MNKKAQSVLPYVVLAVIIAIAFFAMRVYLVRSFQEKFRQTGDVFGGGDQYEPGQTEVTN